MASSALSMTKTPPYSVSSEKAVVAAMLKDPGIVPAVRAALSDGTVFFRSDLGQLYDAMLAAGAGEALTGTDAMLAALQPLDRFGGEAVLRDLLGGARGPGEAVRHARTVAEKARMRSLISVAERILRDAYHGGGDYATILGEARRRLEALTTPER